MADKQAPSTSVAGRADAELCFAYYDPSTDDLDFLTDYFWYAIFTGDKSPEYRRQALLASAILCSQIYAQIPDRISATEADTPSCRHPKASAANKGLSN
jgi:hypothetical protein